MEEKLALSQSELQHVRSSITEYESLLDSYKIQVYVATFQLLYSGLTPETVSYCDTVLLTQIMLLLLTLHRLEEPELRQMSIVLVWLKQSRRPSQSGNSWTRR